VAAHLGLVLSTFLAAAVEFVEAATIVLAMGKTRGWRSTIWGMLAALVVLASVTAVAGFALAESLPESLLQLVIGALLLIFGLQWLRKAILRSSGFKALHDEDETFRREQEAARLAGGETRFGLDWFGFVVSFKAVFLEGLEVVFIVITFGLSAGSVALASAGAALALACVLIAALLARRPLARVPENSIKFAVGLLLSTFGTFWVVEGLGYFSPNRASVEWPIGDGAILALLAVWVAFSFGAVRVLRRVREERTALGAAR
jgi:Ca2+/H+ antiporter, TMEM165/GDT1 family